VTAIHVRDAFLPDVEARGQDPMRNLAAAILERAIDDYRAPKPTSRSRVDTWCDAYTSARDFLFGAESNFAFLAGGLGLDPAVIRERLQRVTPKRTVPESAIRKARERLGYTQRELAAIAGIARGTVMRYELGLRTPKPSEMTRLNAALGIRTPRMPEKRL
jgi:DNA-binding XRE family transcriptional regulator